MYHPFRSSPTPRITQPSTSSFMKQENNPGKFVNDSNIKSPDGNRLTTTTGGTKRTSLYHHKTPEKFSDRFTPIRESPDWLIRYGLIHSPTTSTKVVTTKRTKDDEDEIRDESIAYECLLHNELLNAGIEDIREQKTSANDSANKKANPELTPRRNLFRFKLHDDDNIVLNDIRSSPYSLSPVGVTSQNLLRSPKKSFRKISKNPYKVLDAPELQDDFYLNLVDWSSTNLLSVGLGSCVYLWSACTSQVTRLCDLSSSEATNDKVTSVSWYEKGNYVAVGCESGLVQVWDVTANKQINTLVGHNIRVGSLAWNGDILMSGSRDKSIYQRDIRTPNRVPIRKLEAHKQEVCGLKWSCDNQSLASGGNDNKLYVWNMHSPVPCQAYEHAAAVKAIAWSPHHYGLLASGGGTQDRKIRFWNTLTGQPMQTVDTGSQVCNLAWSKHAPEFVSTHGYSQNQVLVWKYPSLTQVARLTGHQQRVLYLATSPDGLSIVTGAGDETLRFWNVFSKTKPRKVSKSALNLFGSMR